MKRGPYKDAKKYTLYIKIFIVFIIFPKARVKKKGKQIPFIYIWKNIYKKLFAEY